MGFELARLEGKVHFGEDYNFDLGIVEDVIREDLNKTFEEVFEKYPALAYIDGAFGDGPDDINIDIYMPAIPTEEDDSPGIGWRLNLVDIFSYLNDERFGADVLIDFADRLEKLAFKARANAGARAKQEELMKNSCPR